MCHLTDLATLLALPQHRPTLFSDTPSFDLETVTQTAESIVHDTGTVQIVATGRVDQDARDAFCSWIVDAWLALPTAEHISQLCQAAGFSGVVSTEVMRHRIDELHQTIGAQLRELSQCYERIAVLHATGQALLATWEQGDLAYAMRRLAALLPK
jgi:hypothetical protein